MISELRPVYERALQILEEYGWHQGARVAQDHSVCTLGALYCAALEITPAQLHANEHHCAFPGLQYREGISLFIAARTNLYHELDLGPVNDAHAHVNVHSYWDVADWNDSPEREFHHVRDVLKRAADRV